MKQVAGRLRLDLAQYRELAAVAQFGSELDRATRAQLERGQRITEVLKHPQYEPMPLAQQVTIIYAVTHGFLDDVPVDQSKAFEAAFHRYMAAQESELVETIARGNALTPELEKDLERAIKEFKALGTYSV